MSVMRKIQPYKQDIESCSKNYISLQAGHRNGFRYGNGCFEKYIAIYMTKLYGYERMAMV